MDKIFPGAYCVVDDISRVIMPELCSISMEKAHVVPETELAHVYVGMSRDFLIYRGICSVQQHR